jgi:hypothetical protein
MICTTDTISGNTRFGVLLELNATGAFWCGSNLKNNSPADVFCAGDSVAASDNKAALGKMSCPGYSQLPRGVDRRPPPKPKKSW